MCGGQKRQHEDVAVPEDVASVRGAGQASRSDGRFADVSDRAHQVEQRESHEPLELVVALDANVRRLPAVRPALAVFIEKRLEAESSRFFDSSYRLFRVRRFLRTRNVRRHAFNRVVV
jgi:hypothetical protein